MTTGAKMERALEPGIGKIVDLPFDRALDRTVQGLQREGFGVLTRIDVQATLQERLGAAMAPFVILGACNPQLAHEALQIEPRVGLLLPCNVVVREIAGGGVRVEAINALAMLGLFSSSGLEKVAGQVNERLSRVVAGV